MIRTFNNREELLKFVQANALSAEKEEILLTAMCLHFLKFSTSKLYKGITIHADDFHVEELQDAPDGNHLFLADGDVIYTDSEIELEAIGGTVDISKNLSFYYHVTFATCLKTDSQSSDNHQENIYVLDGILNTCEVKFVRNKKSSKYLKDFQEKSIEKHSGTTEKLKSFK